MVKPQFAAFYCVHNDDRWLEYSIRSIYPAMDAIYFLVAEEPWRGLLEDNYKTLRCIETFPDPDGKLHLVRGSWKGEVEQRNHALAELTVAGFDYAFIIDADEIYETQQLRGALEHVSQQPEVGCWHCCFVHYWKSPFYRIDPIDAHNPPVLLKLGTGGFVEFRNCLATSHKLIPPSILFCHHMSYARSDQEILRKISTFSHSHQIDPEWFEKKWKRWDIDNSVTDLCPYNPGAFHHTAYVEHSVLPEVLRNADPRDLIPR